MRQNVNLTRYPALYMYLANLPQGIASYPQARTKADLLLSVRDRWPQLETNVALPPDIAAAIWRPYRQGEWASEVAFMALHALAHDVLYPNRGEYLELCYSVIRQTTSKFVSGLMIHFVTPALVGKFAPKRWAMLREGTVWSTLELTDASMVAQLEFPAHLYSGLMVQGLGKGLQAVLDGTRARQSAVSSTLLSPTRCQFQATWGKV